MSTKGEVWYLRNGLENVIEEWQANHEIKFAFLTNGTVPNETDSSPSLLDYVEVTPSGNYVAGGILLDTWGNMVSVGTNRAGTTATVVDITTLPQLDANVNNPTNAVWGLVYNDTLAAKPALFYTWFGGAYEMHTYEFSWSFSNYGLGNWTISASSNITFFDQFLKNAFVDWEGSDDIRVAIVDGTVTPDSSSSDPLLGDFSEVGSAGSYTTGGTSIGSLSSLVSGQLIDSNTNPSWAADGNNDTDARWAIVYNATQPNDPCVCYVDLGGVVNMATNPLQINWPSSGIGQLGAA